MMPSRRIFFRLKTTPGRQIAGVPTRLWNSMPITVARIMGLNMPTPGIWRSANAASAMTPVSASPGRAAMTASAKMAPAERDWAGSDMEGLSKPIPHYSD